MYHKSRGERLKNDWRQCRLLAQHKKTIFPFFFLDFFIAIYRLRCVLSRLKTRRRIAFAFDWKINLRACRRMPQSLVRPIKSTSICLWRLFCKTSTEFVTNWFERQKCIVSLVKCKLITHRLAENFLINMKFDSTKESTPTKRNDEWNLIT